MCFLKGLVLLEFYLRREVAQYLLDPFGCLNIADIERAAKISGSRFWFLKNEGALLELALQRYAIDFMLKKGYSLILPPNMINKSE